MEDNKKISIVTAYYNRRKLFYNTLKTIELSKYKDLVEIIAVDDASDDENRIDDFPNLFNLDIKIIRVEKKDKWWMNPCIPFNIGFKEAKGEIIIIQNPECLHFGDIIEYIVDNIKENNYLTFGAYSIDNTNTHSINKINFDNPGFKNQIGKIITPLRNASIISDGTNGWYNHSVYRPLMLHFCSAIMKTDLDDLGGFDERYSGGIAYDDNDFLLRIKRKNMNVEIVDRPFVIHQFHGNTQYGTKQQFVIKNESLYRSVLINNTKNYKANQ